MADVRTQQLSEPGPRHNGVSGTAGWVHRLLFTPVDASERRKFYVSLCALVMVVCAGVGIGQHPIAFPLDDAYITLHNAQVLLSGTDRNFPGVPALLGATSPIHLAIVAALMLGLNPLLASFVAGSIAIVLYAAGLARLAFQNGGSKTLAAILIVFGTLTGYAPFQLLNGLETGLAMAAVTWALIFATAPVRTLKLPLVCGVLPFIRPELVALSALLLAQQTWRRVQDRDGVSKIALDFALAGVVAAPWLCWLWASLGTLIPLTAQAKATFFAEAALPAWQKIRLLDGGVAQAGIVPFLFIFLVPRLTALSVSLWIFVLAVLGAFYLSFPGGAGQNGSRYVFVLLPILVWAFIDGWDRKPFAGPLTLILCLFSVVSSCNGVSEYIGGARWTRTEFPVVAEWINENIPPEHSILIHDAGYVAFATNAHLVDMVGLKTPESVAYHKSLTAPSSGRLRGKALSEIAQRFNADYAVILENREHWWGTLADDLLQEGWTLTPVRIPATQYGYIVYQLARAS